MNAPNFCELPNEIWLNILTYLTLRDQQNLRLASKGLQELIDDTKFMEKWALKLGEHNIKDIRTLIENNEANNLSFKHLQLAYINNNEDLEVILQNKGSEVRSLNMKAIVATQHLTETMSKLECLQLDFSSISTNNINYLNLSKLHNLQQLQLHHNYDQSEVTEMLLFQVTQAPSSLALKHLKLDSMYSTEQCLLQLLEQHANTLQQLHINFSDEAALPYADWQRVLQQMQHLETLKLTGLCHEEFLNTIFSALPERACLKRLELSGLCQLRDNSLIYLLRKWKNSLQNLDLMFCVKLSDDAIAELRILTNLSVLNLSHCRYVSCKGLLAGIASKCNTVMKELYLTDLPELDASSVAVMLQRLPNLQVLNLNNCPKAVDDTSLSIIFRELTRLRSLSFDDCTKICDANLQGYGVQQASISHLRGLQELSLRSCRYLSNESLAHALHLPELRKLKLGYCHKITNAGIENLVKHCPALECLIISSCVMITDKAIFAIGQNLKRLRILNISNCTNVTEKAIDYITLKLPALQDLSAYGIDYMRMRDAQKRLLAIKPALMKL